MSRITGGSVRCDVCKAVYPTGHDQVQRTKDSAWPLDHMDEAELLLVMRGDWCATCRRSIEQAIGEAIGRMQAHRSREVVS